MSRDFGVRAAVVTAVKKYQRLAGADQMKIQKADRDFSLGVNVLQMIVLVHEWIK